jgi:hypothetical protein
MNFFKRFTMLSALIMLILAFALPAAAQYDQDDIDQAECVHIEMTLDATGEYIFYFMYQDLFNQALSGSVSGLTPNITISVAEPNTTRVFNVIVAPQTAVIVANPFGTSAALMLEDGLFFAFSFGTITASSGDMDTECLGAATDGRINRFDQQMLAVIYTDGKGGYDIWAVDPATSEGTFDYHVSRAEVDAGLAAAGTGWQTLGIGSTSSFYAAADGQCVLNSPNAGGEMQTFVFACTAEE